MHTNEIIGADFARALADLSREISRQIGVLIDRQGHVCFVAIGDAHRIVLPDIKRYRAAPDRLRGLRFIHTHLTEEPLTQDDLTDLALLRFDMVCAITVRPSGLPGIMYAAHLLQREEKQKNIWTVLEPKMPWEYKFDFLEFIEELEREWGRAQGRGKDALKRERAILVGIWSTGDKDAEERMLELEELASSASLFVLDKFIQHRPKIDPKTVLGKGKLQDLAIHSMQCGADIIIFDRELTPAQVRELTKIIELKILDRTQLILDIFAQRAQSREGKLQVELAQLKYLLPRLAGSAKDLEQITGGVGAKGGIGTRGPGETKLEVDRRRAKDKVVRLQKEMDEIRLQRQQRRSLREQHRIPVVSIVGYTNAGKSTLLNILTKSEVLAERRMFATLDPTSRKLRLPREQEVIMSDTVGFIRDLPPELLDAFRATLEEIGHSSLIIHLVDAASSAWQKQMESVNETLVQLGFDKIPAILVFNKTDLISKGSFEPIAKKLGGITISAINLETLPVLLNKIEKELCTNTAASASVLES